MQFRCHFGVILASFWCHFGALGCHWATQGPQDAPRRFQNRFCLHFGVPLGPLGAPFGVTFRSLWPSRGPKNRKKRRTEGCLFAGSIFDRIFSTFWVPGTPKNKDSVWEWYTKPHFRPRPKKTRFRTDLGMVLGNIWYHVGSLWVTFGARGHLFCDFLRIDFPIDFSWILECPPPSPQELCGRGPNPWGASKTANGEKSIAKR